MPIEECPNFVGPGSSGKPEFSTPDGLFTFHGKASPIKRGPSLVFDRKFPWVHLAKNDYGPKRGVCLIDGEISTNTRFLELRGNPSTTVKIEGPCFKCMTDCDGRATRINQV